MQLHVHTLDQWLDEYAESHRNPVNKLFHWFCIPLIVFSIAGLLRAIPVGNVWVNATTLVGVLVLLYYLMLSPRLAAGMLMIFALLYVLVQGVHSTAGAAEIPLMVAIFLVAWIGQFVGHHIEGARPSFFKDIQFLLIGPLWLLAHVFRRLRWLERAPAPAARG